MINFVRTHHTNVFVREMAAVVNHQFNRRWATDLKFDFISFEYLVIYYSSPFFFQFPVVLKMRRGKPEKGIPNTVNTKFVVIIVFQCLYIHIVCRLTIQRVFTHKNIFLFFSTSNYRIIVTIFVLFCTHYYLVHK